MYKREQSVDFISEFLKLLYVDSDKRIGCCLILSLPQRRNWYKRGTCTRMKKYSIK